MNVAVNPPKTPVTEGSSDLAGRRISNDCDPLLLFQAKANVNGVPCPRNQFRVY